MSTINTIISQPNLVSHTHTHTHTHTERERERDIYIYIYIYIYTHTCKGSKQKVAEMYNLLTNILYSTFFSSHVGGGFNGALLAPGRRGTTSHGTRNSVNQGIPALQGTKLAPNMGHNVPPPPPYPQEPSPNDQWQQSPVQAVNQGIVYHGIMVIMNICNKWMLIILKWDSLELISHGHWNEFLLMQIS